MVELVPSERWPEAVFHVLAHVAGTAHLPASLFDSRYVDFVALEERATALYDWVRGFLFALGCIQALQCNRNTCPTGITTHDEKLQRGLHPPSKAERVAQYAKNLTKEVGIIAHACGVPEPRRLRSPEYMDSFVNPPEYLEAERRRLEERMAARKRLMAGISRTHG